ncbi:MAG: metallophosphoesterase family protein [Clostridia bacterium]|nr:metallophosphoesterase family protein [Clostridia bacterium]
MVRDILIVSDTHGMATRLSEIIEYRQKLLSEKEVLNVIFLGDGLNDLFLCREYDNIINYAVRGNCDIGIYFSPYGEEIPLYRTISFGNHKIFMTHGHTLNVKYDREELCRAAAAENADIALFGHTHVPTLEYIKKGSIRGVERDLVLFNPGSLGDFNGSFGNLSFSDDGFLFSHGKYHNIVKN